MFVILMKHWCEHNQEEGHFFYCICALKQSETVHTTKAEEKKRKDSQQSLNYKCVRAAWIKQMKCTARVLQQVINNVSLLTGSWAGVNASEKKNIIYPNKLFCTTNKSFQ